MSGEVVISGIGCRLPESDSLDEFIQKISAGENLVTLDKKDDALGHLQDIVRCSGKLRSPFKFDCSFFGVSLFVAKSMDPMTRHILERTFEAIIDAGINPSEVKGTNATVFSGTSFSDHDIKWVGEINGGYGIMGRNRCMNSNRVSYWLDLNGTSVSVDSTWTSGLQNLYLASHSLRKGECDIALVASACIARTSDIDIQMNDVGFLSADGRNMDFDDEGTGYTRGDAVVVFVLQLASTARRCYATIVDTVNEYYGEGNTVQFQQNQKHWEKLLSEFYENHKLQLEKLHYIEAYGTGNKEANVAELNAIEKVLCKSQKKPLLIGSVKSNIGHCEASSASCGILKAIACFEKGIILQNYNYNTPNKQCRGLLNGKLKVVKENTPLPKDALIGVNGHGFGGNYGHILLKPNLKEKVNSYDGLPRLVLLADRMDNFIPDLISKVEEMPFDVEAVGLLHQAYSRKIDMYLARGYTIVPKPQIGPLHEYATFNNEKRPVWLIFSGMGSQWTGMARRLMELEVFRRSVEQSHKVLEPYGLDLKRIVTEEDPKIFDNILHCFVGIAAVQIALVDILQALDIVPDFMIGHSVGELGCAYADGCLTAEQMILAAYYRGRASVEADLIKGYMAAIGKGYNEIKDQLPEGIEVACHNSSSSCTISGPAEQVQAYVEQLKAEGVFARTVNVANIAYHSSYIRPAAPRLLQYLQKVIPKPKARSLKWISTSNLEVDWGTDLAKFCSADYHTNNLLSSVFFEEGCKRIHKNGICIEVAPHGLLQAILKRSLNETCLNISMTHKSADDSVIFLLQAIGKMYMAGLHPQISNIYPKVEFPVSRGTPSLHHLVSWQHDQDVNIATFKGSTKYLFNVREELLQISADGIGLIVNDKNIYPASLLLMFVLRTCTALAQRKLLDSSVVFESIKFHNTALEVLRGFQDLRVTYQRGSGLFEVLTPENEMIISGRITYLLGEPKEKPWPKLNTETEVILTSQDIYLSFKQRGYDIGSSLQNLQSLSIGPVHWRGNISSNSTFLQTLEAILQLHLLHAIEDAHQILLPKEIERLTIHPAVHDRHKNAAVVSEGLELDYDVLQNTLRCGGVEVKGVKTLALQKATQDLKFETKKFLFLNDFNAKDYNGFIEACLTVASDNTPNKVDKTIIHVPSDLRTGSLLTFIKNTPETSELEITTEPVPENSQGYLRITFCNEVASCTSGSFPGEGFILLETEKLPQATHNTAIISQFATHPGKYLVFMKMLPLDPVPVIYVSKWQGESELVRSVKEIGAVGVKKICAVVRDTWDADRIYSFTVQMQQHSYNPLVWVFISDTTAPDFNPDAFFYKDQLRKGLKINIVQNGSWATIQNRIFVKKSNNVKAVKSAVEIEHLLDNKNDSNQSHHIQQVEFVGKRIGSRADPVMGLAYFDPTSKTATPDPSLTYSIPSGWTPEEAVTVPLSYSLAYYNFLIMKGENLREFETVLVTDAWTYQGFAAVAVALPRCRKVLATVKDHRERALLLEAFPQIQDQDIFYHTDKDFQSKLELQLTGDLPKVIYNCVEGDQLLSIVQCLGRFGRLFHLGDSDVTKNTHLGLAVFLRSVSFFSVHPSKMVQRLQETKEEIQTLVKKGIETGEVKPMPKMLMKQSYDETKKKLLKIGSITKNCRGIKFRPNSDSNFLVLGDETDVWLDVAEAIVRLGARSLVVARASATTSERIRHRIERMRSKGSCKLTFYSGKDIKTKVLDLINNNLRPITAVFATAMTNEEKWNDILHEVDVGWRSPDGHLVIATKTQGQFSTLCQKRHELGLPSTNFVWQMENNLFGAHIESIVQFAGEEPVIRVTPTQTQRTTLNPDQALDAILPSTYDDYCSLGGSLCREVAFEELSSLAGLSYSESTERSPLFFFPGYERDAASTLHQLAKHLSHPTFYAKPLHLGNMSVENMATSYLPCMMNINGKKLSFNVVGVSWGSTLALEVTRQLEKRGHRVGLILIDGPLQGLREALLDSDVLNVEAHHKIAYTDEVAEHDDIETPAERRSRKTNVKKAVAYLNDSLESFRHYDFEKLWLKGPVTLVHSVQYAEKERYIKLSNCMSTMAMSSTYDDLLQSKDLSRFIEGTAIGDHMSEKTFQAPSWTELNDFVQEELFGDHEANPHYLI